METSCLRDLSSVWFFRVFFALDIQTPPEVFTVFGWYVLGVQIPNLRRWPCGCHRLVTKAVVMVSAMNLANLMGRILVSWDPQVVVPEISHDGFPHGTKRYDTR